MKPEQEIEVISVSKQGTSAFQTGGWQDPFLDRLMKENESYRRADELVVSVSGGHGWKMGEELPPLERVLYREICRLTRQITGAVRDADRLRFELATKEAEIAKVSEDIGAVVDAWPLA